MQDLAVPVLVHEPLSAGYRRLVLDAPTIAHAARPGQFVHIRVTGLETAALRRPFSIYEAENNRLAILYKTVGRGTDRLSRLRPGDTLNVLGPLGNGFPLTASGPSLLVAGGYGVAPLVFLARHLPAKGLALIGGRTTEDVLCAENFEALGWEVRSATMDGSRGTRGMVSDLLDAWISRHAADTPPAAIYACGPDGMLRAVGARSASLDCPIWLSLDKHMVCGVGACLACVQRLRRPDGTTCLGRVCRDGPIFEARTVVWEDAK